MPDFKLIMFDCDGTLADSQHLIVEAMQRAFSGCGLTPPGRASILHTVGLSVPDAIAALAPAQEATVLSALSSAYRDWCFSIRQDGQNLEPMFPGAAALLRKLARRDDILLGLATGKSRRGVQRLIETERLAGFFATLQTADDAPSKPHPAMLYAAMAETGASPADTIMIGDTSYDMAMARNAGVMAIGVSWGYHPPANLKRAGAAHIVHSFAELGALLGIKAPAHTTLAAAE